MYKGFPQYLSLEGEGETGHFSVYSGKTTDRAIKNFLTRHNKNGRWCKVFMLTDMYDKMFPEAGVYIEWPPEGHEGFYRSVPYGIWED